MMKLSKKQLYFGAIGLILIALAIWYFYPKRRPEEEPNNSGSSSTTTATSTTSLNACGGFFNLGGL